MQLLQGSGITSSFLVVVFILFYYIVAFSLNIAHNIIYFHALYKDDCRFSFDNENSEILVYKNGSFIFKVTLCNDIYENVFCVNKSNNLMLNADSSNSVLNKSCLWHYLLRHINKKRIAKI